MLRSLSRATLIACALGVAAMAQAPQSSDAGSFLTLRYATFDPLAGVPQVPETLRSAADQNLWIVQFAGRPDQAGRDAVASTGAQIHGYLPNNAYVVRMSAANTAAVQALTMVRWVGRYEPAYRIDPVLVQENVIQNEDTALFNIVVVNKRTDKPALSNNIRRIGGVVHNEQPGSLLLTAQLNGEQLRQAAGFDQVLWIDQWTPGEEDMDNARIQGGGNYVESQGNYSGTGVNAHIYEGIEAGHPDFTGGATAVRSSATAQTHGHATGGIVFGNGNSNPAVRGMAPDAGKFYTNYTTVSTSRYQVVSDLVNIHNVSHTTASWGGGRTFFYTGTSADADDIVFDHDITWTQSQSNAGNQDSRPEAWAKNVFSVGGVFHQNDSNPNNDSWGGGGSTGPASDGRIKPTLCAYYDNIGTSDRQGSAGYSSGNWTAGFGGTSGATPIVAGHNVLLIEMFTDESATPGFGVFGNQLRNPGGSAFSNRPHFTTLKAMQVVSAAQYAFNSGSTNNRREHQGWGFPDLRKLWDNRAKTFIIDEVDVMTQGQTRSWAINVAPGESALKICLNWAEPAGNPAAAQQLVNNLSLRVTSPGGTTQYWGNNGLEDGLWSVAGGSEDNINSLECVFVQNPAAGNWNVEVIATQINQDGHVETGAVDSDYGLVVSGGTGTQVQFATFSKFGAGCAGSPTVPVPCPELNPNGGALTLDLRDNEYCYEVQNTGVLQVQSFDIWVASTGGNQTVPAHIYGSTGNGPTTNPIASTTITIGTAQQFYTATFATPVNVNGTFYVGVDGSAQTVYVTTLNSGANGTGYYRDLVNGPAAWTLSGLVTTPSYRVNCIAAPTPLTPAMGNNGLPVPGLSYDLTVSDALGNAFALLVSGQSEQAVPVPLPGAPGCNLLIASEVIDLAVTNAAGNASSTIGVPNNSGLIGLELYHQWAILDAPANALGIVVSDAGRATIGN